MLHHSLDVDMELTCIELISKKHGSLLGAMLSERHSLINNTGFNLNCLWNENAYSVVIPTDHPTADVHTKADKLQTMVVALNVLFDVFKILCIELHRKKGNDFYSTCPHRLSSSMKSNADEAKLKRLQDHLSSDCKYNPFKFCNTSDNEKLLLSSLFTSIQDRSRYQACDRAGTYSKETYEFNAMLLYDYEEYESRHLMNPMNDGGNGGKCVIAHSIVMGTI